MDDRRVGLEVVMTGLDKDRPDAYEQEIVGDEAAELAAELGMVIGRGRDMRATPLERVRWDIEGDTARRFEDVGYGSNRSSTVESL
jgi:hypothetical protein